MKLKIECIIPYENGILGRHPKEEEVEPGSVLVFPKTSPSVIHSQNNILEVLKVGPLSEPTFLGRRVAIDTNRVTKICLDPDAKDDLDRYAFIFTKEDIRAIVE